MKKLLYIIAAMLTMSGCVRGGTEIEPVNYVEVGDDVPPIDITDNYDYVFNSEEAGIKALIVLFSTTCPDCQDALPLIEETWRKMKDDPDFRFIALARGQVAADVEKYFTDEKRNYTMPWHEDPDRRYYGMFAGNYIPRLYVVRDGKIYWYTIYLPDRMTSDDLIKKINGN